MKLLVATIVLMTALSGCATTYQSEGFSGGFNETRYAADVFEVSFKGNGYTSEQRASDLALLRSADLTLQNGYQFFAIITAGTTSDTYTFTTPERTVTTGTVQTYGNTGYINAQSQTYGGHTISAVWPTATKMFKMFREEPNWLPMFFDAAFICESIGKKYEVSCAALSPQSDPPASR